MDKMDSFWANSNAKKNVTKLNKMGIPPISSQNTKHKTQNTKYKIQNTKYKIKSKRMQVAGRSERTYHVCERSPVGDVRLAAVVPLPVPRIIPDK